MGMLILTRDLAIDSLRLLCAASRKRKCSGNLLNTKKQMGHAQLNCPRSACQAYWKRWESRKPRMGLSEGLDGLGTAPQFMSWARDRLFLWYRCHRPFVTSISKQLSKSESLPIHDMTKRLRLVRLSASLHLYLVCASRRSLFRSFSSLFSMNT